MRRLRSIHDISSRFSNSSLRALVRTPLIEIPLLRASFFNSRGIATVVGDTCFPFFNIVVAIYVNIEGCVYLSVYKVPNAPFAPDAPFVL